MEDDVCCKLKGLAAVVLTTTSNVIFFFMIKEVIENVYSR